MAVIVNRSISPPRSARCFWRPSLSRSSIYLQALDLPGGMLHRTQVRDAAVGVAVGYTVRLNPDLPTFAHLEASAWKLDGSGEHITCSESPARYQCEALGIDDRGQIGGILDRLSYGVVDGPEGVYWADAQATPFPLAGQIRSLLDRSAILDVDGRWMVGEGVYARKRHSWLRAWWAGHRVRPTS